MGRFRFAFVAAFQICWFGAAAVASPTSTMWALGHGEFGEFGAGALDVHSLPIRMDTNVSGVSGGALHTLVLKRDGTLWGTGDNSSGQLGLGLHETAVDTLRPIAFDVIAMSAGYYHSLFLKRDHTLWAVGWNDVGQLGDGSQITRFRPVQVATDVASMSAGYGHSLFLKTDGTLWATGAGDYGQLGTGSMVNVSVPVKIASDVAAAAAGIYHSAFIKRDGTLWTMGDNQSGQLGNGSTINSSVPIPVESGVTRVTAGGYFTAFIKSDGTLWTMGENASGQLGDGTNANRPRPVSIAPDVIAAAGGIDHLLFLKNDGAAWSTGGNLAGQLGDDFHEGYRPNPARVLGGVSAVVAGVSGSFFLLEDGTLLAAGANDAHQFGNGSSLHAIALRLGDDIAEASLGSQHAVYLKRDGTLWAAGANDAGQIGDGSVRLDSPYLPPPFAPLTLIARDVVAASARNSYHTMFIQSDGTLWAAGRNLFGQLGDGTHTNRSTPLQIATDVTAVDTSFSSSLFLKRDGTLWGVGWNQFGELQQGGPEHILTPVLLARDVAQFAAGNNFSLWVTSDGALWGRGDNGAGVLGTGSQGILRSPVRIASDVAAVTCGTDHTLFVKRDGTLWGMGANRVNGQLGLIEPDPASPQLFPAVHRRASNQLSPAMIATEVAAAAAGGAHSAFLKKDGSLWVMGYNASSQLGAAPGETIDTPLQIASGVERIFAGPATLAFLQREPPVIDASPHGGALRFGQSAPLTVEAHGAAPLSYQWLRDGTGIAGANASTFTATSAGRYSVIVGGTVVSDVAVLSTPSRLANLSARARAGTGENLLIAGFVVSGPEGANKTFLLRGVGPALKLLGVQRALEQPSIALWDHRGSGEPLATNTAWGSDPYPPRLSAFAAAVGAFPFAADSLDSATVAAVAAGSYSMHLSGFGGTEGVGLAELYELDDQTPSQVANLSARGRVGAGEDALIAGFVVTGSEPVTLLIRGVGPTLATQGIAAPLARPSLRVHRGARVLAANDDWGSAPDRSAIAAAASKVGAFSLGEQSKDAALLLTVDPGVYSAVVSDAGDAGGIALAEIYLVPQ